MKDEIGKRIKQYYEDALRIQLPRQTHVVLRIDGRSFHQFTRGLERPYCRPLADALDAAAQALCEEMTGCRFAYGQSDEYSFLLTDFEREKSKMWFEGNLQKIVSVSASVFTGAFARAFASREIASFDCRALVIPQASEVAKYFLWRQLDASANSLNMLASAHYSHAELLGKSEPEKHELLHAKGLNWAKEPADFKRGRAVLRGEDGKWAVDREIPIFQRNPTYLGRFLRL
ncbi:tRNA(His) guanylyltransferase Thg1 family protein [Bryobacter aggregatus]|uniref:tRNA(His) guanylyltransferase Thg1 family protein n=1 Tax=Bryobacter aggregatus TaxID=360054 RepID=UPI0004E20B79|nr:tRNA(His) guanylyltransferase Thg1 family protein [Bryobacter aggregatus]